MNDHQGIAMSLTLPKPAGILRSRLSKAIEPFVSEAENDATIVAVLRALESVGFSISGTGWLDDDEPLASAFRQEGLDEEGMPMDEGLDQANELFLDATEVGDLPSAWEDTSEGNS